VVTLDTNIAVYAVSRIASKAGIAAQVIARASFVSVQLLNEYANVLNRKQRLPWAEVLPLLEDLRAAVPSVRSIDKTDHQQAVRLARSYQLPFYDSLMLAVALSGGARTIYSEDMQHGMIIDDTLAIVNPFAPGAVA
jgi:predicted nucleic acid-binding protein